MIHKPRGAQEEDRLHAAVGSVIRTGAEVRSAGKAVGRAGRSLLLYYFFGMMGFGLLMSGTPAWFKFLVGAVGYQLFKLFKGRTARLSEDG